ncbi:MAG: nitrile hydratase accessory protein [Gammaproteobacteria bacterium]|nr:nitrile hydratase accessory protein [Gammaproteobacteria bacterium]
MAVAPANADLEQVPGLPTDDEGVVFAAPWEAKAFALVVHLHQRGAFEWSAWVKALAAEIAADKTRGAATPYYQLWLTAAESLMTSQALIDGERLNTTRATLRAAQTSAPGHDHVH